LDPNKSNLLLCVYSPKPGTPSAEAMVGLAWVELSTGRFEAASYQARELSDQISRLEPAEILVREDDSALGADPLSRWALTRRPVWQFGIDEATRVLHEHFDVLELSGMGWDTSPEDRLAISAAGAAIAYLRETQKTPMDHIQQLLPARMFQCMEIDASTRRSLELTQTIRTASR
jgi:DNA mismatch repair protein MutS